MPPKKAVKPSDVALPVVCRPPTDNDFQIMSTVRTIQQYSNTECKWKHRLHRSANSTEQTKRKMTQLNTSMDQCKAAILVLDTQVEEMCQRIINAAVTFPTLTIAQLLLNNYEPGAVVASSATQHDMNTPQGSRLPSAVAKRVEVGGGVGGKLANSSSSSNVNYSEYGTPSDQSIALRIQQMKALSQMVQTLYKSPRLFKEQQPKCPQNQEEMQSELNAANKLESSLMAASQVSTPPVVQKKGQPPLDKKLLNNNSQAGVYKVATEEEELNSRHELFSFPQYRALDPNLMSFIAVWRSRRLRLVATIDMFEASKVPLQQRIDTHAHVGTVGQYGALGAKCRMEFAVSEEAALQKIRSLQDEEFTAKMNLQRAPESIVGAPVPKKK